jgi:UDP-3-O-[3-hydroxymyristoyl] N-acetylglucosamine deacetylase/3-hydroxyacyl-[acyl-carrier-protein] dehydratase
MVMMEYQKTIKEEVSYCGVGLHTGAKSTIVLKPAPAFSGIKFVRVDLPQKPTIRAEISSAVFAPRRTTLRAGNVEVHTVEHLMAALMGLGIDNLTIEINANEIPEVDGSAAPFVEMLTRAGIQNQEEEKTRRTLTQPISISENGASIIATPANELKISFVLDYNHPFVEIQFASFPITREIFEKELSPARTFCLKTEVPELIKQGCGKGANHGNTVVIEDNTVRDGKLRFANEFVRHKILDLIGDLLLGPPFNAHIFATRSGHRLNIALLRKIQKHFAEEDTPRNQTLDIEEIQKILPHRYPFLLVDKIIEMVEDKKIVGIKNVTFNEPFFSGHFPGKPIMPGVLIVEAMAQTAGALILKKWKGSGKLAYLAAIDKVKLRHPVFPGDQLKLEIEVKRIREEAGKVAAIARVDNRIVAEAELLFSLSHA